MQRWEVIRLEQREKNPNDPVWWLLIPGFVMGLGIVIFAAFGVMGGLGKTWIEVGSIKFGYLWLPLIFIAVAMAGYQFVRQHIERQFTYYALQSGLMMLLTVMGVLAITYAYNQLIEDVTEAQEISTLILNNEVGNAKPLIASEDAVLVDVSLDGDIPLEVEIGNEVYPAFLNPADYEQIPAEKLADTSASIALQRNQRVQVYVPLERGFGLPPATLEAEGLVQIEGGGVIGGGAGTVNANILIGEDATVLIPYDIFVTGDVGANVIERSGYTMPIRTALNGLFAIIIAIAALYFMTDALRRISEDKQPRLRFGLMVGRVAIVLLGLLAFFYVASAIIFYRQAAEAIDSLTTEQFTQAYLYTTGELPSSQGIIHTDFAAQMMFFPQLVMITTGAILLFVAYQLWTGARQRETTLGAVGNIFVAIALMVGGWMLISELPAVFTVAGRDSLAVRDALARTAIFSFGTIPPQLMLGLVLAYLLFYEIEYGKGIYRLIYFMPYITPRVATATIFTVIFSLEATGLANQGLGALGIDPLLWLKEPNGIVQVIYEILGGDPRHVPTIFEGPTLAITTVILFNVWVYAGYNAVIFLAGLGSIPGELYEAAKVDGAGRWPAFRHITFPLLSPVTFFLSMLSLIGTFRAFGSIYVLQSQAAGQEVDTLTIRIFEEYRRASNPGYGASLAFILFGVIVLLTVTQNKLAKDRVFYG